MKKPLTRVQADAIIVDFLDDSMSIVDIARKHRRSRSTVLSISVAYGVDGLTRSSHLTKHSERKVRWQHAGNIQRYGMVLRKRFFGLGQPTLPKRVESGITSSEG